MELTTGAYALHGLSSINVILGKNGCGKSTLLKAAESQLSNQPEWKTTYITPERGGMLVYQPNVEANIASNNRWLADSRRANQFNQFREQTLYQYRMLERRIQADLEASVEAGNVKHPKTFISTVSRINLLLENIEVVRTRDDPFKIRLRKDSTFIKPELISSGEAELIGLAIECMAFAEDTEGVSKGTTRVLFLDEPDVHLHPDLQVRFVNFLVDLVTEYKFTIVIATHSTAILGALVGYEHARLALMKAGDKDLTFDSIDDQYKKILPVFGAHPLSNVFNQAPVLLVEGEDDERIWQQAVRSSNGQLKLYPVVCGSVNEMKPYEDRVDKIASSVYDNARAFSLRDGDDDLSGRIDDSPTVTRMKLMCRAAENLLLTDEVLSEAGTNWSTVKARIEKWLQSGIEHPKRQAMQEFSDAGFDRRGASIKEIRMLLVGEFMASNKPWEVLVGRVLAHLTQTEAASKLSAGSTSIYAFLGSKVIEQLIPK
jgi:energy-coupling factor transporter ATP-binding protein EcfA2